MTKKEKATPEKVAALKKLRDQFKSTDADTQKQRVLEGLRLFPLTTFELMRYLDVYYPPARVRELRQDGHQIVTLRTPTDTEAGISHVVGLYVLMANDADKELVA